MAGTDWDLLSSYAGLLSLATISIYAGSFGSLPSKPIGGFKRPDINAEDEDEDEDEDIAERLSSADAWLFPVIGSVVLFGLYLVVRYLGKEWINWLLGWYFAVAGVGSVWQSMIALAKLTVGSARWKKFDKISLLALKGPKEIISISFRTPSLFIFPFAALPSALYSFNAASRKSALLSDILALSFSHNALSLLKLDSFKTGCILLSGLFLYDIWWVFGTEVMVKVATSLDVPIKLLWPKAANFSTARGFTMLGLGDVVIPGTFIALALRYDHYKSSMAGGSSKKSHSYFYAALTAYVAGLATTMTVMHVFGKAQPALLYLSPACILSFFITASLRGELKDAWAWSDEPPKKESKEENEKEGGITVTSTENEKTSDTLHVENGAATESELASAAEGEGETDGEGKGKKKKSKKKKAAS